MIEKLKQKYAEVNDKKGLANILSKKLGLSSQTISNHWFGTYLNIPSEHRETVLREIQKTLKKQRKSLDRAIAL